MLGQDLTRCQFNCNVATNAAVCSHCQNGNKESKQGAVLSTRNVKVMSRMCDMTNMLLIGEVKGPRPPGCRRSSFDDVALSDCQKRRTSRLYRDEQDRLLWIDKTCPAHYV